MLLDDTFHLFIKSLNSSLCEYPFRLILIVSMTPLQRNWATTLRGSNCLGCRWSFGLMQRTNLGRLIPELLQPIRFNNSASECLKYVAAVCWPRDCEASPTKPEDES